MPKQVWHFPRLIVPLYCTVYYMVIIMIQLSDHFSYSRLARFTWPTILMTIISSVYGVVDGIMVSNFAGTTQFAAVNLIWPFVSILGAVGFMIGSGGSALVAKTLGAGNETRARSIFSLLTYTSVIVAVCLSVIGLILRKKVCILLGADGEMLYLANRYSAILLASLPAFVLQIFFQFFLITAERPKMGMWVTLAAGIANVVLDILLIGVMGLGVVGAAVATAAGWAIGGIIPLIYFILRKKPAALRLRRCVFDRKALIQTAGNGLSEFAMNISLSFVSMLYIAILLREMGENGVAAYGIMMYFAYVFIAVFLGFAAGSAPVVSFHYGADNREEMHNLLVKSLKMVSVGAVAITLLSQVLARPLSSVFVGYDAELLDLTTRAFRIYSLHFLVTGYNIYASAFFTALNNGPVSALIAMLRTVILETASILVIPAIFGIDAIWWAVFVAESLTLLVTIYLLLHMRRRYGY